MEDAVESLVVEEESKKWVKAKSRFRRRRNKSIENNNSSMVMEQETQGNMPSKYEEPAEEPTCKEPAHSLTNGIVRHTSSSAKNSSCLLLRLFESKLFDMSLAISYLFKSKETGVQAYLGNKLFVSTCK